jgi:hypothetical protein
MKLGIGEPFRLFYQSGNEHDMRDAFGLILLEIDGGGQIAIEQRARNGMIKNHWKGATDRAVIERVLSHLGAAGYPTVPDHQIPRGARLRSIAIESGAETTHTYPTEWTAADAMPGYREAYQLLDSIIMQVTSGALKMRVDPLDELVARAPG